MCKGALYTEDSFQSLSFFLQISVKKKHAAVSEQTSSEADDEQLGRLRKQGRDYMNNGRDCAVDTSIQNLPPPACCINASHYAIMVLSLL